MAALTEKLSAAKRWKELQHEQQRLTARIDSLRQKQTSTQHTLDTVKQQESTCEQTARALKEKLERAKEDERQKRHLMAEAELLGRELQEATKAEKRAQSERGAAGVALSRAEYTAQHVRHDLAQAEEQGQAARTALEDNQRRHEAAHLRATLHVGDACPVCQTIVNAIPAAQEAEDDLKTLQAQMERVQQDTEQKRKEAQETHAGVAALRVRLDAAAQELGERVRVRQEVQDRFVSRFPGYASLAEALRALRVQHKELGAMLKDVAVQTASAERAKVNLLRHRETAQQEAAKLGEALRGAMERLDTNTSESDARAREIAAFLTPYEDPEQSVAHRRTAVMQAEQQVKEAEKTVREGESVLGALHTRQVQKEGDLKLLASEYGGALLGAEREAQAVRACLGVAEDALLPKAEEIEGERNVLSHKQISHADLSRREERMQSRQARAERQATESQADLQARTRMLEESQQKQRQAQSMLEKEREKLQEAIARQNLTDTGADGENIKPQLETVRGQMMSLQEHRGRLEAKQTAAELRWKEKEQEEKKLHAAQTEERLASDLRKLLGSEFTDFLSRGAIEALMHDASGHLQRLTHGRYVFDIAYQGRTINLRILDYEDHRRARPTHSLSGGETFLASLAIALALSQGFRTVATGRAAKTSTECLILDEGFGTLDREGVQMVTEILQELRGEEGRMVGIITHVEEVAAAMPLRIEVRKGGRTSEVRVLG